MDARYLVFSLDHGRYALPLEVVERVLPAAEVTPLPSSPEVVLGVLNYRGRILPVLNLRLRFRLPGREMELSDVLILSHTRRRPVLLHADEVKGVAAHGTENLVAADNIAPDLAHFRGVVRDPDGLVLIQDLDAFLSLDEREQLQAALAKTEDCQ